MSLSYQSDWLYVGMDGGNVHLVQVSNFQVSGYTIYWDKVTAHEALVNGGYEREGRVWERGEGVGERGGYGVGG